MNKKSINTVIVGVGNCASSLVQTVVATRDGALSADNPGIIHASICGYSIGDIRFVGAFDVDIRKVDLDLGKAIFASPNCASRHIAVPPLGVIVTAGPLEDGIEGELSNIVDVHPHARIVDHDAVSTLLRAWRADVVVCYLPTGASLAARAYAKAAAATGTAFVNAMPEAVANDPELQAAFEAGGAPLLGDDVKSQLGATAVHTALLDLCMSRAARVDSTYQLNIGGNADFLNLSNNARAASKRATKRSALTAAGLDDSASVYAGPSGYVPHLGDNKVAYIRIDGRLLLDMRYSLEVHLQVEDSPNSAGVVVDAIRIAMAARERGRKGLIAEPCSFLFKNAPVKATEPAARAMFAAYLCDLERSETLEPSPKTPT
jgi:myo-inositol-1-phosphate synthase